MVEWITLLSLIVFGLAVLVIEIIFVPGTTVVGLIGIIFMIIGIGLAFRSFGGAIGWITAGGTASASGIVLYLAFKTNVWKRFSLKTTMDGKVNEGELDAVTPGQEGVTLSALRPIGKAELNNRTYEVRTLGNYVEPGSRIRVNQVKDHQIFVELVNQ